MTKNEIDQLEKSFQMVDNEDGSMTVVIPYNSKLAAVLIEIGFRKLVNDAIDEAEAKD